MTLRPDFSHPFLVRVDSVYPLTFRVLIAASCAQISSKMEIFEESIGLLMHCAMKSVCTLVLAMFIMSCLENTVYSHRY